MEEKQHPTVSCYLLAFNEKEKIADGKARSLLLPLMEYIPHTVSVREAGEPSTPERQDKDGEMRRG